MYTQRSLSLFTLKPERGFCLYQNKTKQNVLPPGIAWALIKLQAHGKGQGKAETTPPEGAGAWGSERRPSRCRHRFCSRAGRRGPSGWTRGCGLPGRRLSVPRLSPRENRPRVCPAPACVLCPGKAGRRSSLCCKSSRITLLVRVATYSFTCDLLLHQTPPPQPLPCHLLRNFKVCHVWMAPLCYLEFLRAFS